MSGWIKSYRQILDNPVVCKDSDHFAVWNYILLSATHKELPVMFGGEKVMLQPGQFITGRKSIAEKFNIDESKVTRILKLFENEQQIEQQTSNKNRIITVLSWSKYQDGEQQDEQEVNNKRTTNEQQVNTNKKLRTKELKNEINKEQTNTFSAYTPNTDLQESLKSFVDFRKSIKKPMTEKAVTLLLKNLDKLGNSDDEKIEILEQSIVNGWQGIFELKDKGNLKTLHRPQGNRQMSSFERLQQILKEEQDGQGPNNQANHDLFS